MTDVTCIGEVLVDFVATSHGTLSEAPAFAKCAGGACANVAVGLAKLGLRTAFAGKVGADAFGNFLRQELRNNNVDVHNLTFDRKHKTRLAFVSLTRSGERDFEFWENRPADERLRAQDVDMKQLASSALVHIGSFPLVREPSRSAILKIARRLVSKGIAISFDPNIRWSLYDSKREMKKLFLEITGYATYLRLNSGEARFLTGKKQPADAAECLLALGPKLVAVTDGEKGCFLLTRNESCFIKGFRVKAVDTTGCGDSFLAGLLSGILATGSLPERLSKQQLISLGTFANAAGALTATKRGVFPALPTRREVLRFLQSRNKRA